MAMGAFKPFVFWVVEAPTPTDMIIIYRFAHGGEIISVFTMPVGATIGRPRNDKI